MMTFMRLYRKGKSFYLKKHYAIAKVIKALCRIYYHCDIPYEAEIADDVYFCHNAFDVVINPTAKIGGGYYYSALCNDWRNG